MLQFFSLLSRRVGYYESCSELWSNQTLDVFFSLLLDWIPLFIFSLESSKVFLSIPNKSNSVDWLGK